MTRGKVCACGMRHSAGKAAQLPYSLPDINKKPDARSGFLFMVGEAGFGPAKSVTTDLQSAPFGRSGIPPYYMELVIGVEPTTC